jgi:hypothetical protein
MSGSGRPARRTTRPAHSTDPAAERDEALDRLSEPHFLGRLEEEQRQGDEVDRDPPCGHW